MGNPNYCRKTKILPTSFKMPQEGSMHFAIVCEFLLRPETSLNPDLANSAPEPL